jgi:hypothetical protein
MKNWIWALAVVLVVGGVVFSQKQSLPRSVPLPQEEDTVRLFFNLIDEGRVTEAVMMMAPESINDDERKQAWGVQWSSFEDIRVVSLEPAAGSLYKVVGKYSTHALLWFWKRTVYALGGVGKSE